MMKAVILALLLQFLSIQPVDTGEAQAPQQAARQYRHREPIVVQATVTAYTASVEECGKDDGITASMVAADVGHIAMDSVPFGTLVHIEGVGNFVVTDRFGGGYGSDRIDIYMASRSSANRFGRQVRNAYIFVEDKAGE